jgi:hypothetical protein
MIYDTAYSCLWKDRDIDAGELRRQAWGIDQRFNLDSK